MWKLFLSGWVMAAIVLLGLSGCSGGGSDADEVPTLNVFTGSVDENSPVGTVVGEVSVDDGGSAVTAIVLSGTGAENFDISLSGAITTKIAFDYESQTSYLLSAYATNAVGDGSAAAVTININNLNDNSPLITSLATFSVDENQLSALTLTATDGDGDTVSFGISGSDAADFTVDSVTGVVTFKTAPDYETKQSYAFTAAANDGTNETTQSVILNINDVVETPTAELYIKSAVYDNNRTVTVLDDRLYVYFNTSIDPASILADASANYDVNGTGAIDENSLSDYNDTLLHRHRLQLADSGSGTVAFIAGDTNISLTANTITAANGLYPVDYNLTTVEAFRPVLQTGQSVTYAANDDGNTTRGQARSYTDNGNGTVADNSAGLIWQKEDDNVMRSWSDAAAYCSSYSPDGATSWRLPTIEELIQLTDKGRVDPAIDPVFTNTNSSHYWSSTTYASGTSGASGAWGVFFDYGGDGNAYIRTYNGYVRCVCPADH